MFAFLLQCGADPYVLDQRTVDTEKKKGWMPHHMAARSGAVDILKMIKGHRLTAGGKGVLIFSTVNLASGSEAPTHVTARQLAIANKKESAASFLQEWEEECRGREDVL